MPTQVRTPDGKIAVFPDGMSDAAIEAVMRREYPPAAAGGYRGDVAARTQANVDALKTTIAGVKAHPDLTAAPRILGGVANYVTNAFGIPIASGVDRAMEPLVKGANNAFGSHLDPHYLTDQLLNAGSLALGGAGEASAALRETSALKAARTGAAESTAAARGAPAAAGPPVRPGPAPRNAFRPPPTIAHAAPTPAGPATAPAGGAPPKSVSSLSPAETSVHAAPSPAPASAGGAPPQSVSSLSPVESSALRKFVRVAKPDVNAMTGKAAAYSDAGIDPTLVDTTGRRGQAVVRALASKPTPAQDAVEAFAEQRRVGLASRMSDQARDIVSSDPRTPDDIAKDVVQARSEQAQKDFGPIRPQLVKVTPEMANALESPYGRDAIRDAIKRTVDGKERDALQLVADHINPGQSGIASGSLDGAKMTIGQLQDVSKALFDRASTSAVPQEQGALTAFGKAIREGAKAQSPDYVDALANFEAASRLAEAPAIGASALSPKGTDTFLSQVQSLGGAAPDPEAPVSGAPDTIGVQLARAGYRRAIETASGGGRPGTAQGVAQTLADAPEMQAKNLALLGPEDAGKLQNAMRLERQAVINAANASPGAGSNTFLNQVAGGAVNGEVSAGDVGKTVASAASLAHGNPVPGAMQTLELYLKQTRAFSDDEAAALAQLAIDPSRHADALQFISDRAGPQAAEDLAPVMQQAAADAAPVQPAAVAPAAVAAANAFAPPLPAQPQGQQPSQ